SPQAVAALTYVQSLYTLPVSLFGMSVSAAELPAMSSALGSRDQIYDQLRHRLDDGLHRIAFFIVPSVMAMMAFGDVMTGALYQTGRFNRADSTYVWGFWPVQPSACSHRRRVDCTRQLTTHCTTRARRF